MYPATLIAAYFVDKAIKDGRPLTQMKLQKILYFAQGYHLTKYGEPVLKEDIQAWKFGPVVPEIYQQYKSYGSDLILSNDNVKDPTVLPSNYSLANVATRLRDTIDYTWRATKNITAERLSSWTHNVDSPWHKSYSPYEYAVKIENDVIKEYFDTFLTHKENG